MPSERKHRDQLAAVEAFGRTIKAAGESLRNRNFDAEDRYYGAGRAFRTFATEVDEFGYSGDKLEFFSMYLSKLFLSINEDSEARTHTERLRTAVTYMTRQLSIEVTKITIIDRREASNLKLPKLMELMFKSIEILNKMVNTPNYGSLSLSNGLLNLGSLWVAGGDILIDWGSGGLGFSPWVDACVCDNVSCARDCGFFCCTCEWFPSEPE